LGELAQLVSFGTIIGLGSYYVQTQGISLQAFVATLPLGIMLFSMIVINEIPDFKEDRAAGKLTLVARFGKKAGVKLYLVSWVCTYGVILAGVLFRIMPITTLLALLSLPLTLKSMQTLRLNYEDPVRMAPANLNMIRAHSVTAIGLSAGDVIYGLNNGAGLFQLTFLLGAFAVLYFPAGLSLIRRPQH
jgi:1,4-dihydroxy-2-naphthoate octaprenyltransferase